MPWVLFVFAIGAVALAVNAHRPPRRPAPLALIAFFAGWLTSEAPLHAIAVVVLTAATLVGLDGLDHAIGMIGLALCALACVVMFRQRTLAGEVSEIIEAALEESLGGGHRTGTDSPAAAGEVAERAAGRTTSPGILPRRPLEVERQGRDIVYHRVGRIELTLDVYRHRSRPSNCPTFLYVHGGGWVIGNKRQQGLPTIHHLAARGWTCVTIDYRLSPRATFPDHLIDVKRAIKWIRDHGRDYGADPDFILIGGGSAGAHLAALAALTPNVDEYQRDFLDTDTGVRGCVAYYGVYDFADRDKLWPHGQFAPFLEKVVMKLDRASAPEAFDNASPIYRLSAAAPPFLVIHGAADSLVPVESARAFVARFREVAPQAITYIELPRAQHAFEVFRSRRTVQIVDAVERYGRHLHRRYLDGCRSTDER